MRAPYQNTKTSARGAVQKADATFVAAWIPNDIVAAMDAEVLRSDLDRSKLLRKALRNLLLTRPA